MARDIAAVVGSAIKKGKYLQCGSDVIVTWCLGHLLEACSPVDLDQKKYKTWSLEYLPIIQDRLEVAPIRSSKEQLDAIRVLLKEHPDAEVVHACDAGREGQVIGDELLNYLRFKGPVKRLWVNDLTPESVRKGLASMRDNSAYSGLSQAGRARRFCDWTYGINLTRYFTVLGRKSDPNLGVVSYGRVQTPILRLIVMRDRERENFTPTTYYVVSGDFRTRELKVFSAQYVPDKHSLHVDEQGRLLDKNAAAAVAGRSRGPGEIVRLVKGEKVLPPPLPYDLAALQIDANRKIGTTAAETLAVTQSLYEKKAVTYPRTDCRYLPEEPHARAAEIFGVVSSIPGAPEAGDADANIKSAAWDTQKVVAHSGLMPTGSMPDSPLTADESAIFNLIAERFFLQFYKPFLYEAVSAIIRVGEDIWSANGRKVLDPGWRQRAGAWAEADDPDGEPLPPLAEGEVLACREATVTAKKTTVPLPYTDATIIVAMKEIHKFVKDPKQKAKLKETDGIGTPASRADFIEKLLKREYIMRTGKKLTSTPFGRNAVDVFPEFLTDPGMTAIMESELNRIAEGEFAEKSYCEQIGEQLKHIINDLNKSS
jgi:DNA topoisomerase-3